MTGLHLEVFTSPARAIRGDGDRTFSPTTATLIYGDTDAVLVDSLMIAEDIDALGDTIAAIGKRLTTIFITHGHGDHFFGSDRLSERFPGAKVVTTSGIARYIDSHVESDVRWFQALFGDAAVMPTSRPSAMSGDVIVLEGNELRIIEVGQGDIAPTAVLHVPTIGAVIAGDVAYNQIHPMLGFGGPKEWLKWLESLDTIERLVPRTVIAGHKKAGASNDATAILDGTRSYIVDFAEAARSSADVPELVSAMRSKYPTYGNITTLLFSANAAIEARKAGA